MVAASTMTVGHLIASNGRVHGALQQLLGD